MFINLMLWPGGKYGEENFLKDLWRISQQCFFFFFFKQNTTLVWARRKTPRSGHDKNDLCCLADVCEFPGSLCVTAGC